MENGKSQSWTDAALGPSVCWAEGVYEFRPCLWLPLGAVCVTNSPAFVPQAQSPGEWNETSVSGCCLLTGTVLQVNLQKCGPCLIIVVIHVESERFFYPWHKIKQKNNSIFLANLVSLTGRDSHAEEMLPWLLASVANQPLVHVGECFRVFITDSKSSSSSNKYPDTRTVHVDMTIVYNSVKHMDGYIHYNLQEWL